MGYLGRSPAHGSPPFDTFLSKESDPWIVVGKRQVPDSAPLDEWIGRLKSDQIITYKPDECSPTEDRRPHDTRRRTRRDARLSLPVGRAQGCRGTSNRKARGCTGWVVMCYSEEGRAGALAEHEQQCDQWLSTFEFAK